MSEAYKGDNPTGVSLLACSYDTSNTSNAVKR